MNQTDGFDKSKRRTLQLLAGGTVSGLAIGLSPAIAGTHAAAKSFDTATALGAGNGLIECLLISRADGSRIHMLMHNKTDSAVLATSLESQSVIFGGTALNMADAFTKSVIIPANDRVMVRMDINAVMRQLTSTKNVIDLNADTRYLPRGSRQVALTIQLSDGVGTVTSKPVFA